MKLLDKLNKIWTFLDGKKTYIGLTGHALWLIANLIFKDLSTPEQAAYGHLIIGGFTGVKSVDLQMLNWWIYFC